MVLTMIVTGMSEAVMLIITLTLTLTLTLT